MRTGRIRDLLNRDDRAIAKLANQATIDIIHGGCRAQILAERLARMGCSFDAYEVVSNVYKTSTGKSLPQYRVCVCDTCGQTVLGEEAALRCCADLDEPEQEFVDGDEDDIGDYEIDRRLGFDPDICGDRDHE